jgi:hypothetical protein
MFDTKPADVLCELKGNSPGAVHGFLRNGRHVSGQQGAPVTGLIFNPAFRYNMYLGIVVSHISSFLLPIIFFPDKRINCRSNREQSCIHLWPMRQKTLAKSLKMKYIKDIGKGRG